MDMMGHTSRNKNIWLYQNVVTPITSGEITSGTLTTSSRVTTLTGIPKITSGVKDNVSDDTEDRFGVIAVVFLLPVTFIGLVAAVNQNRDEERGNAK